MTTTPDSFAPSANFATGHFFGRFAEPNYPGMFKRFYLTDPSGFATKLTSVVCLFVTGNPNPSNPPPAQLVMPDFAKSPGGFGVGEEMINGTFYVVVLEEYVTGTVSC